MARIPFPFPGFTTVGAMLALLFLVFFPLVTGAPFAGFANVAGLAPSPADAGARSVHVSRDVNMNTSIEVSSHTYLRHPQCSDNHCPSLRLSTKQPHSRATTAPHRPFTMSRAMPPLSKPTAPPWYTTLSAAATGRSRRIISTN